MKKLLLLNLLLLITLTGCASTRLKEQQAAFTAKNNSLVGKNFEALVNEMGVPTAEAKLTDGRRVVEYLITHTDMIDGGSYVVPSSAYIRNPNGSGGVVCVSHMELHQLPPRFRLHSCKLDFTVSGQNTIESWKALGSECY